jgi:hypothetical protein
VLTRKVNFNTIFNWTNQKITRLKLKLGIRLRVSIWSNIFKKFLQECNQNQSRRQQIQWYEKYSLQIREWIETNQANSNEKLSWRF